MVHPRIMKIHKNLSGDISNNFPNFTVIGCMIFEFIESYIHTYINTSRPHQDCMEYQIRYWKKQHKNGLIYFANFSQPVCRIGFCRNPGEGKDLGSSQKEITSSYRPLCMLETTGKVFEGVISNRIEEYPEQVHAISDNQFGFRSGRSTTDAISVVCKIGHQMAGWS